MPHTKLGKCLTTDDVPVDQAKACTENDLQLCDGEGGANYELVVRNGGQGVLHELSKHGFG